MADDPAMMSSTWIARLQLHIPGLFEPNAAANAIGYAEHYSRSADAVIRVL
jgi:hypothetical protein